MRISGDIDIFHDRESLVEKAAQADRKILEGLGLTVEWVQRLPGIWRCVVKGGPEPLRLDWAHDSAFRFYPAKADPKFGYVLHSADLMTNKILAAAGRSQPRDLVDMATLSVDVPIVAGILAAVGKDPGMTPDTVIDNIAMFGRHNQSAFDRLRSTGPIDGTAIQTQVRQALTVARTLAEGLPAKSFGRLFIEDGRIVVPDPDRHRRDRGRRRRAQVFAAAMTSLKTISLAVFVDNAPLVRTVLCRTVAKTDSIGFVVRR